MSVVYDERMVEPGERAPAPGGLRTVQLLVNSRNIEDDLELFDRPEVAGQWLFDKDLAENPGLVGTDRELGRVLALREALRRLLAASHDGVEPSAETAEIVAAVAEAGGLSVEPDPQAGVRVVATAGGLDGALARVVLIATEAAATGLWRRLKVCSNSGCEWAFWDGSRNRGGRWCVMSLCGNQSKVRAHRQRAST